VSKKSKGLCALLAAVMLLGGCRAAGETPQEQPAPAPALAQTVPANSFDTDDLHAFSWALLRSLPQSESNVAISPSETATLLAMMQCAAANGIDDQISAVLGAQEISPKRVNEYTLQRRRLVNAWSAGPYAMQLRLVVGENQPVKESYLDTLRDELELDADFEAVPLNTANEVYSAWADEVSMGLVDEVSWELPAAEMPYITSLQYIQNYWQTALDPARTVPVPFTYANGETAAIPMVAVNQSCGIYKGDDGAMGILPLTDDNYRLIVMLPGEEMTLEDLLENIGPSYTLWKKEADWGEQRVAIPKFSARYDGSLKESLNALDITDVFSMDKGTPQMGEGTYLADVLVTSTFIVDESGSAAIKETKPFRPGMDDGVETLIVNRPFVFALEDTKSGTIILCGVVRNPMLPL